MKISAGKCYVCRIPMVAGEPDPSSGKVEGIEEVELYGEGYQNICIGCYENLWEHKHGNLEQDGLDEKD